MFRFGEALLNAAEAAFYLNELGVASYNGRSTKTIALDYINAYVSVQVAMCSN